MALLSRTDEPDPGLCVRCVWARRVPGRESVFWMCERSRDDPRYQRYPRLPVRACPGHVERDPADPGPASVPNP